MVTAGQLSITLPIGAGLAINMKPNSMQMLKHGALITVRLLLLLMALVVLIYALIAMSPLDPITAYLGGNLSAVSGEQKQQLINQLGFNQSLPQQFWHWFSQAIQGHLGFSNLYHQEVSQVISERMGLSLILVFSAWLCALICGYLIGLATAIKQHSWWAKGLHRLTLTLTIIPPFWLAMVMVAIFAIKLHWFPSCCAAPLGVLWTQQSMASLLMHIALPLISLVLIYMAPIALHTHEKVIDVLNSDYVKYSQLHGQQPWQTIKFHVLANSMLPAVVLQFAAIAELLGGTMMIETVFNIPGLGSTLVNAAMANDTALLLAISILFAVIVFISSNFGRLFSYQLLPKGVH